MMSNQVGVRFCKGLEHSDRSARMGVALQQFMLSNRYVMLIQ